MHPNQIITLITEAQPYLGTRIKMHPDLLEHAPPFPEFILSGIQMLNSEADTKQPILNPSGNTKTSGRVFAILTPARSKNEDKQYLCPLKSVHYIIRKQK